MRVTIDELAQRLGLSTASVSYALNGQPGVSEATRMRVKALAEQLNWHPSSSARALSRSRSDAIGIILRRDPALLGSEPYYMNLLAGIESVLSEADQTLLFRMVGVSNGDDVAIYRKWSSEGRVDGVFLFDHTVGDERPQVLNELRMPFVAHGSRMTEIGGPTFTYDLAADLALILEHLESLGHRIVAHIAGSQNFTNERNRVTVMREEAHARGMTPIVREGDYGMDLSGELTRQLMRPPTTGCLRRISRRRPTSSTAFPRRLPPVRCCERRSTPGRSSRAIPRSAKASAYPACRSRIV